MRIECLLYLCVLHSNCIYAVGYGCLAICYERMLKQMLERQTTFEQMLQGIHQAREAFTKSLNILLFYSNFDQEILKGKIFSSTCFAVHNNFTDYSVEAPCCFICHEI